MGQDICKNTQLFVLMEIKSVLKTGVDPSSHRRHKGGGLASIIFFARLSF